MPHGPAGVGKARRRMRTQLSDGGVADSVIDDAVLILSELLSNACKHGRPLGDALAGDGDVRAAWQVDPRGRLVVEVTVWVVVHDDVYDPDAGAAGHRREDFAARVTAPSVSRMPGLDFGDVFDDVG